VIRLLCIFGIHCEGIVVRGNWGCCTLCGEDTYAVFIVHKLERNAMDGFYQGNRWVTEFRQATATSPTRARWGIWDVAGEAL